MRALTTIGALIGAALFLAGCQVDPLAFGDAFAKAMEEPINNMEVLSEKEKADFLDALRKVAAEKVQTAQAQPWQDTLTDYGFPLLVGVASMFGINLSRNRARAMRGEPVGAQPKKG